MLSEKSLSETVDHFRFFKKYLMILIIYSVVEFLYEHYLEGLITNSQIETNIWAQLINVGLGFDYTVNELPSYSPGH